VERATIPGSFAAWVRLAVTPSTVWRSSRYALVVGSVLAAINHGDALLAGDWSAARLFRIGLTALVPYCVTTFASVSALRAAARHDRHASS